MDPAYHQVLVDAGVDAPPFDVLWLRYRLGVLYAWVAATTTAAMGSRWQPIEVGSAGMARATEACADLDTVEAIRPPALTFILRGRFVPGLHAATSRP